MRRCVQTFGLYCIYGVIKTQNKAQKMGEILLNLASAQRGYSNSILILIQRS